MQCCYRSNRKSLSHSLSFKAPATQLDSKMICKEVKVNVERKDAVEGLTSLAIQVDEKGQVHSFTDENATWKFVNPITVVELVDKYKMLLANVVVEPKVVTNKVFTKTSLPPQASSDRFFLRR